MKSYEVAVIGGGLSGLITSIYLAKAGKSVIVLERSNRLGGRAITNNKNGALFNLGGHALYRGGDAYATFQELGLKLKGAPPLTNGTLIWKNKLVALPGSLLKMLTSPLFSWSAKIELVKLMAKLGKINSDAVQLLSLRQWADNEIIDPMVRHLFYTLARTATYTYDPDHQLAGPALKQVQSSFKSGVLYLDGGWQSIINPLHEQAKQLGVTLLNNAHVTKLESNETLLTITMADGEYVNTASIVSTLTPADTYRLIGEKGSPTLNRWKEEARPVTAACLDLCLKRLPVANRHFVLGLDQPLFFSNHSRVAKLSDDGSLVMHLVKYHEFGEHDPKADERILEQTMSFIQPGWQKVVVSKQFLPSITIVHDYPHLGKSDFQPGPVVPEHPGLFVAGDWASHGEMLADAAVASAKRAAAQILQKTR